MANCFVLRNNTIELLLGNKGVEYSGYDDISIIPENADYYIWFYQVPIKENTSQLVAETDSYVDKLQLVMQRISPSKRFVVFTLASIYSLQFAGDDTRLAESIMRFNEGVYELGREHANVKIVDTNEFLRQFPSADWIDWKYYFISQQIINPRLASPFKQWFSRKLDEMDLKRKKCLVLDLDNTLWGGVLGEDGIDGIKIGGDYPGNAYLFFQKAIAKLGKYGIILTICSKNNEGDVLELWEKNPYMALKKSDFADYRINWNNKADNIVELSKELNIGLDSMVFIDDNASERELVKQSLPMVEVPDFPQQPYELPSFFQMLLEKYFLVYTVTKEDIGKTQQYKANAARAKDQSHFTSMTAFLRSLGMELSIQPLNNFNLARIAQMTQKTNQFNLTTRRYSDSDIKKMAEKGCGVWCLSVKDRFGDNGITGLIILKNNCIDTFLLSCRILGKGIEFAFLKSMLKLFKQDGIKKVYAQYLPTAKNSQVKDFYDKCGFTCTSQQNGEKHYELDLDTANLAIEDYYLVTIS